MDGVNLLPVFEPWVFLEVPGTEAEFVNFVANDEVRLEPANVPPPVLGFES